MAIVDTDWKAFLEPDNPDNPPDVTFLVGGEGNSSKKRIGAHKTFLAGVSRVFSRQFFGPMKDAREEMEVDWTTPEAFQILIDFIYKSPGPDTFTMSSVKCPKTHFDVFVLADYYEVVGLCEHVKMTLEKFDVTEENFLLSAIAAMEFKEKFEDVSFLFSKRCLKFLQEKNPYDMYNFPGAGADILQRLKEVKDEKLPGNVKNYSDLSININQCYNVVMTSNNVFLLGFEIMASSGPTGARYNKGLGRFEPIIGRGQFYRQLDSQISNQDSCLLFR